MGALMQETMESSKSLLNRALILKSYNPEFQIDSHSTADDVLLMQEGLRRLLSGAAEPISCGHAGTVLRFLALRASRIPGTHRLQGSERLFSRPQQDLIPILLQLGVDAQILKNELLIRSKGWHLLVDGLQVNAQKSSQFASAVLLNCWELTKPMHFTLSRQMVSEGYWQMTLQLVREFGLKAETRGNEVYVPANAKVKSATYKCEPDLSSCFAIAAAGIVANGVEIRDFPARSLQPDKVFVEILERMGVRLARNKNNLQVPQTKFLRGIDVDLNSSPDLLPVLTVLCALARSASVLRNVAHAQFKESARIEKSQELLRLMGANLRMEGSDVYVEPVGVEGRTSTAPLVFDPDHDHRMAMAAEIARLAGYPIQITDKTVVKKSFPHFFALTGSMGSGEKMSSNGNLEHK